MLIFIKPAGIPGTVRFEILEQEEIPKFTSSRNHTVKGIEAKYAPGKAESEPTTAVKPQIEESSCKGDNIANNSADHVESGKDESLEYDSDSTGPYCETIESLPDLEDTESDDDLQAKIDALTQEKANKAKQKAEDKRRKQEQEKAQMKAEQEKNISKVHPTPTNKGDIFIVHINVRQQ